MLDDMLAQYTDALFDTDRDQARRIIRSALDRHIPAEDIVFNVVIPGIEYMAGRLCGSFDISLAQHFLTSQITGEMIDLLLPAFEHPPQVVGRMVIGSSQGDFHGLGKRIVIGCVKTCMVESIDLGLNVSAEKFVQEAISSQAQVIGISSMMVHTARGENGCMRVRQLLKEQKLEDQIKIVVGGAPYRFDPNLYKTVQADAWAENGILAGKVILDLIKEVVK
jgi:methanogenic corrinoid protein MtbC1